MNYYFRKISVFAGCLIMILGSIYYCSWLKLMHPKLNPNVETIFLGDSHIELTIDQSVVPNSANMAHSAEHYLYTYNKLRVLLETNKNIKNVILGVSYHTFAQQYDQYIKDKKKTELYFPRDYLILDQHSRYDARDISFETLFVCVRKIFLLCFDPAIENYPYHTDSYLSYTSDVSDSNIDDAFERHYSESNSIAQFQSKYFLKIIALCQKKKVKVIMINSPIHPKYLKRVPSMYIDYHYKMINKVKSKKVLYYDLHDFALEDKEYFDGDHVNGYGNAKVTNWVLKNIAL